MKMLDRRGFRLGFATFVLFTGIAGDFWRNSLSWYGYGVFVVVIAAISIVVLVHNRARFRVGSLPYPLLAFIALAFLSIAIASTGIIPKSSSAGKMKTEALRDNA